MIDEESRLVQTPNIVDHDVENGPPRPKIARSFLAVMLISTFLASSDDSFVLSTASDIAAEFNATNASTWLITGFNLGYMISLPIYGQLCDAWGRKHTYLFSYIVYSIGCLAMGTSLNIYMAVIARIITGFGSSGMLDLSSILLNDIGGPTGVAVLRSYFMTVTMVGYSGGGAIGGTLYTWVGWRWSFLLHVPIVLACALTTVLQLPKDTPTDRQSTPVNTQGQKEESPDTEKLDYIGISLLVCAIVTALMMVQVFQADEIPENKLYFTIALGSVSLLLGIAFCIYEMCWAETPLIPLSFMLSSKTGVICAVQILTMIADMSFASAVSEYFVRTKGFSMAAASACLAPAGLGGAVGGILAGKYIQRTGKYHKLTRIGLYICIMSAVLIAIRWCYFDPYIWELMYPFPFGIGMGILFSTQFVALSAESPGNYVARLITTYYLLQQIGSVVGVSVTAWLTRSTFASGLKAILGGSAWGMKTMDKILKYRRFAESLPVEIKVRVEFAFRHSFLAVPLLAISALLLTFYLVGGEKDKEKEDQP